MCTTFTLLNGNTGACLMRTFYCGHKKISANQVDSFINAERPDPEIDPVLFEIITEDKIHGICVVFNATSPCV
jgi:hypothetical protein